MERGLKGPDPPCGPLLLVGSPLISSLEPGKKRIQEVSVKESQISMFGRQQIRLVCQLACLCRSQILFMVPCGLLLDFQKQGHNQIGQH